MNFEKLPYFPMYADDFFAGVADLTDEQCGIYVKLLCLAWSKDGLNDVAALQSSRNDNAIETVLSTKFYRADDGKWRNRRQEEVRKKQISLRERGSKGGSQRQANTEANDVANSKPQSQSQRHNQSHSQNQNFAAAKPLRREDLQVAAKSATSICKQYPQSLDRNWVWESCCVAEMLNPGMSSDLASKLRAGGVNRPQAYVNKALKDESQSQGFDLHELKSKVPEPSMKGTQRVPEPLAKTP